MKETMQLTWDELRRKAIRGEVSYEEVLNAVELKIYTLQSRYTELLRIASEMEEKLYFHGSTSESSQILADFQKFKESIPPQEEK